MILEFLRRRSVLIFAIGASLILGFLAFSGMYVLLPLLPLAIVAFVLSFAYEGQIYQENIIAAFNKLFNPNYLKEQLAKECLHELLPKMEAFNAFQFEQMNAKEKALETLNRLIDRIKDGYRPENRELKLMSSLNGDMKNAKLGIVYLNEDTKTYFVKGMKQAIFLPQDTDLTNLNGRLEDAAFKTKILEITSENGDTPLWKKLQKNYNEFLTYYTEYINLKPEQGFVQPQGLCAVAVEPITDALSAKEFINLTPGDAITYLNEKLLKLQKESHSPRFFNDFHRFLTIYHQYDADNLSSYQLAKLSYFSRLNKRTIHLSESEGHICYSLITSTGIKIDKQPTEIKAPKPFSLKNLNHYKAQILAIAQKNKHADADHVDDKQKLKKSLQTLEQVFVNQLFGSPDTHNKYLDQLSSFLDQSFALSALSEEEFVALEKIVADPKKINHANIHNYKYILFTKPELAELRGALSELKAHQILSAKLINPYREDWQAKLNKRRWAFRLTQGLSGIAAIFMILGTSYLLIEAFSVLPFMAAIPFGIWPVIIVPMAVIAGIAFGLLTYNAITDMINDDIMLRRYRKLKEDWQKGLTIKSGLMLITTATLMVLTIALTVCTAGTWWTVIKHTRPLFAFMRAIPAAVVGIAAAVLGLATLAFNVSNTLETLEELDEEAGEHPYDLVLRCDDNNQLRKLSKAKPPSAAGISRPTLIKYGQKCWMIGSLDGKVWQTTALPDHSFDHLNFDKLYLSFSWRHAYTYLMIKRHQAHTFVPSRENGWQWVNPFRLILKLTYTPLRIGLFLGHLVSIGVTSDRLPGLPEVLSALFGIISEFFEDWHYFFSLKHAHRDDIQSLYDEYSGRTGGHEHNDDLPTQILRMFFYPLIYLAAWWDHAMSAPKRDHLPPLSRYYTYWFDSEHLNALSFEAALDKHLGKSEQVDEVPVDEDDLTYLQYAHGLTANQDTATEISSSEPIENSVVFEADQEQTFLVENLAKRASVIGLSMFKQNPCATPSCRSHHRKTVYNNSSLRG